MVHVAMHARSRRERTLFCLRLGFIVLLLSLGWVVGPLDAVAAPQFERDIVPILKAKCIRCHGGEDFHAELDLRTLGSLLKGGESGEVVVRGKPKQSLLLQRIIDGEMPPEDVEQLTPDEVNLLSQWIVAGMSTEKPTQGLTSSFVSDEDRRFWAFRPLARPAVPRLSDMRQIRTPIDAFVLRKLQGHQLTLSSDSEPVRLLRRAYFDLLGLPPSPEAVDAYLADTAPHAYERLVDQLLASPHFGERWGRHWLDTVGYTDTVYYDGNTNYLPGYKEGFIDGRWRYRDYVIDSFNADKSYARFITEQIAGDELVEWRGVEKMTPEIVSTLAATGFWYNGTQFTGQEVEYTWSFLHETMEIFGTSLLGLTLRCARCHSHKHEPIPQEDYYRLLALITPAFNIENWKVPSKRRLPAISSREKEKIDVENTAIDKQIASLNKEVTVLHRNCELRLQDVKFSELPDSIREDVKVAFALPVKDRDLMQRQFIEKFSMDLLVKPAEIEAGLDMTEKSLISVLSSKITTAKAQRGSYGWIQTVYDVGPPPETRLLKRGDYKRPGRIVQPGFLSVLNDEHDIDPSAFEAIPASSGRRRALAHWLTAPNTPASGLVARVLVNRVWQHLLGVGIVPSSENLGKSGDRPTHPELLEWMAAEFVKGGWRIKPLIKQIVMSSVYRQTSRSKVSGVSNDADPLTIDPGNVLLWQARIRRLESEAIRDSMLVVSGLFDPTEGGPPVRLKYSKDGLVSFDETLLSTPAAKWRRSVYLFQRRFYHLTMMGVFDQPMVAGAICRRNASVVTLQSLGLLNDRLVLEKVEHFAKRVSRVAGESRDKQVQAAFRLALARPPQAQESEWSLELLRQQTELYRSELPTGPKAAEKALMHLCRALFNSTEFLYIE